jgi:hypothetical protein
MSRSEHQTTIAISRIHYNALLKLGAKNETFDHIVGNLLKNAKKDIGWLNYSFCNLDADNESIKS